MKKNQLIALALVIGLSIVGSSLIGSTLSAKSQPKSNLKPQIFETPALFKKGLESGDQKVRYSTLVYNKQVEAEIKSLTSFPNHFHKYESHFIYVIKGQADVRIGAMKAIIKPGDFIVIPPGKEYEHELKVIGNQPMQILVFGTPPEG
jgi:quercetin dioxygenase-like cupin family protein